MFRRLSQLVMMGAATIAFWMGVGFIDLVTNSSELRNFAALLAFLSTLALWLVITLDTINTRSDDTKDRQKAKRDTGQDAIQNDPRLALLLQMMTDDERQTLQARLLDSLGGDGEIPLADLLAIQDEAVRRSSRIS